MVDLPRQYGKGDRLRHQDWNRAAKAISDHQSAIENIMPNGRALAMRSMPGIEVLVYNDSGAELVLYNIGGIKEHRHPNKPRNVMLTIETPVAGTHEGKFVIVQEKIKNGGVGRAIIIGCSLCTVSLVDENHEYAEIFGGDATKLESRAAGSARILWHETPAGSGTEDVLALVQFPFDGPPPVWEATADESSGEITAKRIDSTGTLQGEELTFTVLPESSGS